MDKTVLVIDDDPTILLVVTSLLKILGYKVATAPGGREGLSQIDKMLPDAVLCDLKMPNFDGMSVLEQVKKSYPFLPFIVFSGDSDVDSAVAALKEGAWDYLLKPSLDADLLDSVLRKCWERSEFLQLKQNYQKQLEADIRDRTKSLEILCQKQNDLLAEVHHRVKNNLQIILILLNLQKENASNDEVEKIIQECENRIHVMALMQEQLFETRQVNLLNLQNFLSSLTLNLMETLIPGKLLPVDWDVSLETLDPGQAFLLGLVLNEAITGLLTADVYIPSEAKIQISISALEPKGIRLVLKDTWKGLEAWNPGLGSVSFGSTLLKTLVAQSDGQLDFDTNQSSALTIRLFV